MVISTREFKRVWNPKAGKRQFQHYSGGAFFDRMSDINPRLLTGGTTGLGHQPKAKQITDTVKKTIEEEATDVGEAILSKLKLRSGKGIAEKSKSNIETRIQNLISGSGLQVN